MHSQIPLEPAATSLVRPKRDDSAESAPTNLIVCRRCRTCRVCHDCRSMRQWSMKVTYCSTSFSGGDGILQGSVSARRSAAHQNGRHQGCKDQGRHSMQNVLGAGHSSMLVVAERRISSVMARSASRASGTPSDRRGRHRVPRRKSPAGDGPTATVTFHSFIVSDPCRPSTSPTGCSSGAGDHRAMHVPVDEQLGMLPLGALLSSEERRWLPTLRFKLLHRTNAAAGW